MSNKNPCTPHSRNCDPSASPAVAVGSARKPVGVARREGISRRGFGFAIVASEPVGHPAAVNSFKCGNGPGATARVGDGAAKEGLM